MQRDWQCWRIYCSSWFFAGIYGIFRLIHGKTVKAAMSFFSALEKNKKVELAKQIFIHDFLLNKKRSIDIRATSVGGCYDNATDSRITCYDRKSENELSFYRYTADRVMLDYALDSIKYPFSVESTKISALRKVIKDSLGFDDTKKAKNEAAKFISDNKMIF
jgi:hypothetical protein